MDKISIKRRNKMKEHGFIASIAAFIVAFFVPWGEQITKILDSTLPPQLFDWAIILIAGGFLLYQGWNFYEKRKAEQMAVLLEAQRRSNYQSLFTQSTLDGIHKIEDINKGGSS